MKVAKLHFDGNHWKSTFNDEFFDFGLAQIVIGFGERSIIAEKSFYGKIQSKFPNADIVLSSSAGEIIGEEVFEGTVVITALYFSKSSVKCLEVDVSNYNNSYEAGEDILKIISKNGLKWLFVLSDGSNVNGSELVKGLNVNRPKGILISGGLAGDGDNFKATVVGLNTPPRPNKIVAIGFYGDNIQLSHSSFGGWESFGLERTVTRSKNNILYEIDNKNALDLYKKYLGKYVDELPRSALLFPLALQVSNGSDIVVRTILSINEKENYMTFAGDIPENSKVRFMKANMDRLIGAASDAAEECLNFNNESPQLAVIVSCVGRKLVLADRVAEEIETLRLIFGKNTMLTGFYSYGEISPLEPLGDCALHNQTITITTINEIEK